MEAARKVDSSWGWEVGSSVEGAVVAVVVGGVDGRGSGWLIPFVIWVSVGSAIVWEGIPFSFGGVEGAGPSTGAWGASSGLSSWLMSMSPFESGFTSVSIPFTVTFEKSTSSFAVPPKSASASLFSLSPKRESLSLPLNRESAGDPGAASAPAWSRGGEVPLTADSDEIPLARGASLLSESMVPLTLMGSVGASGMGKLDNGRISRLDICWPPPSKLRFDFPVFRSQSTTVLSQLPESTDCSSFASFSTDTAEVCCFRLAICLPSSCLTDCRLIPPVSVPDKSHKPSDCTAKE